MGGKKQNKKRLQGTSLSEEYGTSIICTYLSVSVLGLCKPSTTGHMDSFLDSGGSPPLECQLCVVCSFCFLEQSARLYWTEEWPKKGRDKFLGKSGSGLSDFQCVLVCREVLESPGCHQAVVFTLYNVTIKTITTTN